MLITLTRKIYTDKSTIGNLTFDSFTCFTLEPPKGKCIPAMTYDMTFYQSPKWRRLMPLYLNVPGFSFVEIHWGNRPIDTQGCTLTGESIDTVVPDWINNSRLTFDLFWITLLEKLKEDFQNLQIKVVDGQ